MLHPVLLQTFLAVAQTRSFTQAAERLGLRQSTVSQQVRKREQQAGGRAQALRHESRLRALAHADERPRAPAPFLFYLGYGCRSAR
jgi:hypothetical protein